MTSPPDLALFFGRFHPLLVHLPIGFLLLLAALELLGRWHRFRNATLANGCILAFTVPASILAATCGWMLSLGGNYDPQFLQWHKWTGVGTAVAATLAALLYAMGQSTFYRWVLALTVAVLTVASHLGGSLTHGRDYLTRYAPRPLHALLGGETAPRTPGPAGSQTGDVAGRRAFADVVAPILAQYCVGCHGPEKQKAKLRLDTLEGMQAGGHGPAFLAGNSAKSTLIHRMTLPLADDNHMPPDGKPQPVAEEIKLLAWWIDAGAPADRKVGELNPPPDIRRLLDSRFGAPAPVAQVVAPKPLNDVLPQVELLADALGIAISALAQGEPWLQANASLPGPQFGDAELARLAPLAPNLRWLDLAGTSVTDAGLSAVASMRNLVRLHLEHTAVTDAGLAQLAGLDDLAYLNLYGTAVTDAALPHLRALPRLRQLYLWQTQVTPEAARAFAEERLDKAELQGWKAEIEQLQARIRGRQFTVEFGATNLTVSPTKVVDPL